MKAGLKPREVVPLINAVAKTVTERFKTPQMTSEVVSGVVVDHLIKNGLYVSETARDPLKGSLDPASYDTCVTAFEEMHSGRNLTKHHLRGTYVSPQIAALFKQHMETTRWVLTNSTEELIGYVPIKTCFGTGSEKCARCNHNKKYKEVAVLPRYKRFYFESHAQKLDSHLCQLNDFQYFE